MTTMITTPSSTESNHYDNGHNNIGLPRIKSHPAATFPSLTHESWQEMVFRIFYLLTLIFSTGLILLIILLFFLPHQNNRSHHQLKENIVRMPCRSSNDALKYEIQPSRHRHAKCIDGSNPAFFFRKGGEEGVRKWNIHFEGGGWPYDLTQAYQRSKTDLGSSKHYPTCMKDDLLKFTQSSQKNRNPLMYNWNTVYVKYCDGGSYAGNATAMFHGETLYFRGKAIRDAVINDLLALGMAAASDVVISGCSAGGLGIYFGLDSMRDIIHAKNKHIKVRGLSDSGFFTHHRKVAAFQERKIGDRENAVIDTHLNYAGAMKHIYLLMNLSAGVHPHCRDAIDHPSEDSNCVFAEYNAPYISTPLFALQPKYDRWQLWHILGNPLDYEKVNNYGSSLQHKIESILLSKAQHGAFFDACAHHCMSCSSSDEDPWNGKNIVSDNSWTGQFTPADAFRRWYTALDMSKFDEARKLSKRPSAHLYGQNSSYPCDNCCVCVI